MGANLPVELLREGFGLLAAIGGPLLGGLLVVGLLIGVVQAATQINDPAVGFLPRLVAGLLGAYLLGGWALERMAGFFASALERMAQRG
jgi:flagellar biosynthetic protein FliQ